MKVLVVDDEVGLTEALRKALLMQGCQVQIAHNAEAGLAQVSAWNPDVLLLDIMMPGKMTGLDALRVLRQESEVPVILMSACREDTDKVLGLEYADDYVVKPFSIAEMLARIRAVMRRMGARSQREPAGVIRAGALCIDTETCTVTFAGRNLAYTPTEFRILALLASQPGRVFSRDSLVAHIWGPGAHIDPHALNMHIRGIRSKLEADPACPEHLQTVRGMGFRYAI